MNHFSKVVTTFSVCKFLEEAVKPNKNINGLFETFLTECEYIGGNPEYFLKMATRELHACRLLEQEGGAIPVSIANSIAGGGIAGLKPEEIGVPAEAQKRHTSKNSIFRRRKPNKYYNDESNKY